MKLTITAFSHLRTVCLFAFLFILVGCSKTSAYFQKDADIIRLQHLKYYGELLDEYNKATGKYPFQGQKNVPIYVHVANDEQIEFTKQGPHYPHTVIPFKEFVKEVETKLGRKINEYYDPQYRPDYKPNFYIYMINGDTYYFAIHVHHPFHFAKKIADNYYKIEFSNHPTSKNQAILPQELLASQEFQSELSKQVNKVGFFKERENKYLHFTKTID